MNAIVRDIDSVVDGLGKGIDELIKPLVQALWDIGYNTRQSCEGHIDWGRGYPWVDVIEDRDILALIEALETYNSTNPGVAWELHPYNLYFKTVVLPQLRTKPEKEHTFHAELKPETSNGFGKNSGRQYSVPMHEVGLLRAQESIPLLADFLRTYFSDR